MLYDPRHLVEQIAMIDCLSDGRMHFGVAIGYCDPEIEPYPLQLYERYARWDQTYMDENEVEFDYAELEEEFVLGSPENCIEQLREYEDLGVDQIYLRCHFPRQPQGLTLETTERFGTEGMPTFQ